MASDVAPSRSHEVLLLLVLVGTSVLLVIGKLTGDQWVDLIKWACAFFAGTHVALDLNARRTGSSTATAQAPASTPS